MDCYNYYRYPDASYLAHHGIKGQKWGVRRFQNPDGSLTSAGKRRFNKLIELNDAHKNSVSEVTKAYNKEHSYVKKSGYLKGRSEFYKDAARDLYRDDPKFKEIADDAYKKWKNSQEISSKLIKEMSKVSNSNYNLLTVVGRDRVKQILDDYDKYRKNVE